MKMYRAAVIKIVYFFAEDEEDARLSAGAIAEEEEREEVEISTPTEESIREDRWSNCLVYDPPCGEAMTAEAGLEYNRQVEADLKKLQEWKKTFGSKEA